MRTLSSAVRVLACSVWLLVAPGVALAAPGAAVLVAPAGEISGSTIVFTWNAVSDATWYQLWIGTAQAVTLQQWYTAEQAHCPNGGSCSVTLTLGVGPGAYNWFVQTWNPFGAGPWSLSKGIAIKDSTGTWSRRLPNDRRFTLVFDGTAVLDLESGLTWDRTPSTTATTYGGAWFICAQRILGGRMGWRLPSLAELRTLEDPYTSEGLPEGHPFDLGASASLFWTTTTHTDAANNQIVIQISNVNNISGYLRSQSVRGWCVRGPGNERIVQ